MNDNNEAVSEDKQTVPDPQGHVLGVPYDLRRPTVSKLRSRWWNAEDPRIFTPKTFGAGWDINLYRLLHPGHRSRGK